MSIRLDSMNTPSELESTPFLEDKHEAYQPKARRLFGQEFSHALFLGLCLLCTLINAVLVLQPSHSSFRPASESLKSSALRRPSQYIGFDQIDRSVFNVTPPHPIITRANFLTQVSSAQPSRVFPQPAKPSLTPYGLLFEPLSHFHVEDQVSTLAQYHVRDYGMEDCQLVLDFPPPPAPSANDTFDPELSVRDGSTLAVWALAAVRTPRKDEANLSWNTKPSRTISLPFATFGVSQTGRWSSPPFNCESDSIQMFELACAVPGCRVGFSSDGADNVPAIYLLQHNSL